MSLCFAGRPTRYSLVGFISHVGKNTGCGHYVAHMRKDGRWAIFDDRKVSLCRLRTTGPSRDRRSVTSSLTLHPSINQQPGWHEDHMMFAVNLPAHRCRRYPGSGSAEVACAAGCFGPRSLYIVDYVFCATLGVHLVVAIVTSSLYLPFVPFVSPPSYIPHSPRVCPRWPSRNTLR